MSWGKRITAARKAAGLSQDELAALISTTQPAISKWELEKRQPWIQDFERIAKVLNTTPDWLVFGHGLAPWETVVDLVNVIGEGPRPMKAFPSIRKAKGRRRKGDD